MMESQSLCVMTPWPSHMGVDAALDNGLSLVTTANLYNTNELYMGRMGFYELKYPRHQTDLNDCVPTTLKVLFESQFGIKETLRVWKNKTGCDKFGVNTLEGVRQLEPWLSAQYKIQIFEKAGLTEKDLAALLDRGVIPFIEIPANYRTDVSGENPIVDEDGFHQNHSVIPVEITEDSVLIYDCWVNSGGGATLSKSQIKVILPLPHFLKVWENNQRRAFWFEKKPQKDRTLGEFEKEPKA